MASLDVFKTDAFSMRSLTAAINKLPHKPRLLSSLGIFEQVFIDTPEIWVEEQQGKLSVLPQSAPGAVNAVRSTNRREARNFRVPHVPYEQTILAADIAGKRAFGSESELEAVVPYVNDQLQAMVDDHDVTHEYHRMGALQGNILDSDGATSIYNLFTEFGVTQQEINFWWSASNFGTTLSAVIRAIADKLGGTPFGQIFCLAGDTYFDAMKSHSSVVDAYTRWRDGEYLRMSHLGPEFYSMAVNGFEYQGVMFVNYRGTIGSLDFIADDEAWYFPTGVPGLFQEIYAPAYFMETVNTRALRMYAKQEEMDFNIGRKLHTESNMLAMCTRPSAVIKSTMNNFIGTGS